MTTATATRTHKRCPRCDQNKPLADYHANTAKCGGVASYCKLCSSIVRAENRKPATPAKPPAPKKNPDPTPPIVELVGKLRLDWASRSDARPACAGKLDVLQCHDRLDDGRRDENEARQLCAGCPLRADCRTWVLELPNREDPDDLWICAGLNRKQRSTERRRRRSKKPPKPVPTEKRCRRCKEVKPLTEFGADRRNVDGHTGRCQDCIRIGVRESAERTAAKNAARAQLADRGRIPLKRSA